MKKKKKITPSTFILNVNDISYFFVEGKKSSTGPLYCVYYDDAKEGPANFSVENFVEVHGIHEKETLAKFTKKALLKLTALNGVDERAESVYNTFYEVHALAVSGDKKKPKLGKMKNRFIDALYDYNEIKDLVSIKPEISYDEDYELVKEKDKSVKNVKRYVPDSERKVVKKIVNEYGMTKGVQRKLKYD